MSSTSKPKILFFARGYQAGFFPRLVSDRYEAIFVTLTRAESAEVIKSGQQVAACFETDFDSLVPADFTENYLITSLMSDRFLGRFDTERRKEVLGKEIAFWADLLDRFEPVAVMNELVAIEISEVLLIECRKRGIAYLATMHTVLEDRFLWLHDPMTLSGKSYPDSDPSQKSIDAATEYIDQVVNRAYRPFYVRKLAGRRAMRPLIAALVKWVLWRLRKWRSAHGGAFRYEMYDDEYSKRIEVFFKGLFVRYNKIEDIPQDKEVIFFPLHQEPEATLNYMSEFMANQVATIENILKAMGPQQVLVVKEHPVDKGALLRGKFAELRQRCSNLYFLPGEVEGRQIVALGGRVVTLTSTVGLEAALMGRPVYVMGEIFYDHMPGIKRLASFRQLREELRQPAPVEPPVTIAAATRYLAGTFDQSYPGNPLPWDSLYDCENIKQVIAAICLEIGLDGTQPVLEAN